MSVCVLVRPQTTCTAKGMQVDSIVLLATVPIVPVAAPRNFKLGCVLLSPPGMLPPASTGMQAV